MKKSSLLVSALALIILGIGCFALQPVLDPKPEPKCAKAGARSSGFVDNDKGDCRVSIKSWEKIEDWNTKPKPIRIVGLVLVLGGVVTGVVGLVRKGRKDDNIDNTSLGG